MIEIKSPSKNSAFLPGLLYLGCWLFNFAISFWTFKNIFSETGKSRLLTMLSSSKILIFSMGPIVILSLIIIGSFLITKQFKKFLTSAFVTLIFIAMTKFINIKFDSYVLENILIKQSGVTLDNDPYTLKKIGTYVLSQISFFKFRGNSTYSEVDQSIETNFKEDINAKKAVKELFSQMKQCELNIKDNEKWAVHRKKFWEALYCTHFIFGDSKESFEKLDRIRALFFRIPEMKNYDADETEKIVNNRELRRSTFKDYENVEGKDKYKFCSFQLSEAFVQQRLSKFSAKDSQSPKLGQAEVIKGVLVPAAPDRAANSSLIGVDSNGNGVRDDAERLLGARFGIEGNKELLDLARAYQVFITTPISSIEDLTIQFAAIQSMSKNLPKAVLIQEAKADQWVYQAVLSNPERLQAYNARVSKITFPNPSKSKGE